MFGMEIEIQFTSRLIAFLYPTVVFTLWKRYRKSGKRTYLSRFQPNTDRKLGFWKTDNIYWLLNNCFENVHVDFIMKAPI